MSFLSLNANQALFNPKKMEIFGKLETEKSSFYFLSSKLDLNFISLILNFFETNLNYLKISLSE